MAMVPSLSGSIVAANNQNIAGLVNFNLDISLFKSQPPEEYLPIGSTLSRRRKEEAEDGLQHKTANRLGFLFGDLIPDAPNLIRSYGKRVSEILSKPGINPRGSEKDGPFRDYVGADVTSIWAAATATSASISLHLLACMLARSWDANHATAIWVELIEERRRSIKVRLDNGHSVNPNTHFAALHNYLREDLARWDASARSWLQRADEAMISKHKQIHLIMDNIPLLHNFNHGTTYEQVTRAWFTSMELVEALLNNEQRVTYNRTALVAISSWHLYPDLLVFQEESIKVALDDILFPHAAILSIGTGSRNATLSDKKINALSHWSLALSHLKFYGNPVSVTSSDTGRITIDELWLICLGSILEHWKVPVSEFDVSVQWFAKIGSLLESVILRDLPFFSWLRELCRVATDSMEPFQDGQRCNELALRVVQFGWRRKIQMFNSAPRPPFLPPYPKCPSRAI